MGKRGKVSSVAVRFEVSKFAESFVELFAGDFRREFEARSS